MRLFRQGIEATLIAAVIAAPFILYFWKMTP